MIWHIETETTGHEVYEIEAANMPEALATLHSGAEDPIVSEVLSFEITAMYPLDEEA